MTPIDKIQQELDNLERYLEKYQDAHPTVIEAWQNISRQLCFIKEGLDEVKELGLLEELAEMRANEECPIGCLDKIYVADGCVHVTMYSNSMDYSAGRERFVYTFEELKHEQTK